jgi:hypothetical protein
MAIAGPMTDHERRTVALEYLRASDYAGKDTGRYPWLTGKV